MKIFNLKTSRLCVTCFFIATAYSYSQQGKLTINQDKNITYLLNLKKEINKTVNNSNRYKIQIYNGNRSGAQAAKSKFQTTFNNWTPRVEYEEPNFKTWAGNFGTRLEADRALKKIKRIFPDAFIFKPKKKKDF